MEHKTKSDMKFERVMREFAHGKLESHGTKVTDQKQAIAIAFSEARKINPEYGKKDNGGSLDTIYYPFNIKKSYSIGDVVIRKDENGEYAIKDTIKDKHEEDGIILYDLENGGSYTADELRTIKLNKGCSIGERGAELERIYTKGTAKELWTFWNEQERIHFMIDHIGKQHTPASQEELSKKAYNFLPMDVKKELVIHHATGLYKEGGKLEQGYDVIYKTKSGRLMVAKNVQAINEEQAKEKIKKEMQASSTFNGIHAAWPTLLNGGKITSYRDIPYNEVEDYADKKGLNITDTEQNFKEAAMMLFNEKYAKSKLSPAKKKLQDRINTLERTKSNANAAAQKSIQKKIDKLREQFNYNPSIKEKIAAQKGRFYLDVPTEYAKRIYKSLWKMDIKPELHTLHGNTKVVVNNSQKLEKAYKIYSDILSEKNLPVPPLSKIKGKL